MQVETQSDALPCDEPVAEAAGEPGALFANERKARLERDLEMGLEMGSDRTQNRADNDYSVSTSSHRTATLRSCPIADPASSAVELRIRRQDHPTAVPYWQSFMLEARPGANVVSLLMDLRVHCVTAGGEPVDPIAFEHNCMEEVCGACAMLINGVPRPACSALIADLETPIRLEPLPKFPVVRDLMVDRARLFAHLKQVKAWVQIDGAWDNHERAPRISPQAWAVNYLYSRCMSCGCCLVACPQFRPEQAFVGPAALAQVRLMNAHPTGRFDKVERLHAIMADGGLSDCGNAQNCVRVCPKEIPLTTAIGELGRQTTVQALKDLFGGR